MDKHPIDVVTGLRNTRRAMGDGTMGGRVQVATPRNRRSLTTPAGSTQGESRYVIGHGTRRLFVQSSSPGNTQAAQGDVWIKTN